MRIALVLALIAGCGSGEPSTPHCPPGSQPDEARAAAVRARLASVASGEALIAAAGDRVSCVCFAAPGSTSAVDDTHAILLASDLEEGEAAARFGHLLVHLRDGLPDEGLHRPDCDAAVERALAREATAYVREIELQTEVGARPRMLAFEMSSDVLAAPREEREAIVLAYLRAHPHGAPGIDGLAAGYRERCERQ